MLSAQPRFETNIKPMFREDDRSAMEWKFDLWSYDEVKKRAQLILSLVTVGEMPCDGRWSSDKVAVLRRWIESGMPQ